jgi:hypothetical protein
LQQMKQVIEEENHHLQRAEKLLKERTIIWNKTQKRLKKRTIIWNKQKGHWRQEWSFVTDEKAIEEQNHDVQQMKEGI